MSITITLFLCHHRCHISCTASCIRVANDFENNSAIFFVKADSCIAVIAPDMPNSEDLALVLQSSGEGCFSTKFEMKIGLRFSQLSPDLEIEMALGPKLRLK